MAKKNMMCAAALAVALLSGCASVPMETAARDQQLKAFPSPPNGQAGLYIFRDTLMGAGLKKTIKIDNEIVGETASNTYIYQAITPGNHVIATESEFSDNTLNLTALADKNYYVRQYIKLGVFVGGANLEQVSEAEGQKGVRDTKLAKTLTSAPPIIQEQALVTAPPSANNTQTSNMQLKKQQIQQLQQEAGLSYEEYQSRYRAIMAQ